MSRIVSKRYLGKMPVYNMEVVDTHNFITALGTILHNCRYYSVMRKIEATQQREAAEAEDEDEADDYDSFVCGGEWNDSYLGF